MILGTHIPRDRYIAEVGHTSKALDRAHDFIDRYLDELEIDKLITMFGSGDLYIVQAALDRGIPVKALIPWKGMPPGKSNLKQFNRLWKQCEIEFMNQNIKFNGPAKTYKIQQREIINQSDVMQITWDGVHWNSAKTLANICVPLNHPMVLHLISTQEKLIIYNNKEEQYSKQRLEEIVAQN